MGGARDEAPREERAPRRRENTRDPGRSAAPEPVPPGGAGDRPRRRSRPRGRSGQRIARSFLGLRSRTVEETEGCRMPSTDECFDVIDITLATAGFRCSSSRAATSALPARDRGVHPKLFSAAGSAPASRRAWTIARSPLSAARCSGSQSWDACISTSAPISMRYLAISTCPRVAAQKSGVQPSQLGALTSARQSSTRNLTILTCPETAARCSAVSPYSSVSFAEPPSYRRLSTCRMLPCRAATPILVRPASYVLLMASSFNCARVSISSKSSEPSAAVPVSVPTPGKDGCWKSPS
mmetsp:Transcript_15299/g.36414  ORF Transcript_15299/g.36414 Transcript_15299/m.36414 type:complete len:296 (+) Transcript_15299:210-1097(+)